MGGGKCFGRLGQDNQRDAGFGDPRLLARNFSKRVPQIMLVIDPDAGDPARRRALDDIRRVEPPAEPDLEDADIGRGA